MSRWHFLYLVNLTDVQHSILNEISKYLGVIYSCKGMFVSKSFLVVFDTDLNGFHQELEWSMEFRQTWVPRSVWVEILKIF